MVVELREKAAVQDGAVVIQHWKRLGPEGTFASGFNVLSPGCKKPERNISEPGVPLVTEKYTYEALSVGQSTTVHGSFFSKTVRNLGDVGGVTVQSNWWPFVRRLLGEPSVRRVEVVEAT